MGVKHRKEAQGYLSENRRPQCSNCKQSSGLAETYCDRGCFSVSASGWCPAWAPNVRWLQINADFVKAGFLEKANRREV